MTSPSSSPQAPALPADSPTSSSAAGGRKRVVCAAMLMRDGLIITGVRHFSPDMRAVMERAYGKGYHLLVREQGFIDTHGNFLSRETAWLNAQDNNQIRKQVSTPATLYSENLY